MASVKIIDCDQLGGGKSFYIKDLDKFLGAQKRENACYVAPELIKGEWHIRNDEWSVGVLMYTMLTGMPPFNHENYKETFKQIQAYKFDQ
jgi:Protein kinase domain